MSNLPVPGVVDATGVGDTAILPANSSYLRMVGNDKRLVVHDGVTVGGIKHATKPEVDAKPDRFPAAPASTVSSDYDELFAGFTQRFYDSVNNRLFPCRGLGPDNAGCPDTSLPDGSGNKLSPWMWGMAIRVLAERVRTNIARGTSTTASIARVQNSWNYFKTQFTTTQMTSTVYGTNQIYGLADDAALLTNAFMDVWDTTGDTTALRIAVEAHAAAFIMFQDTRPQNPIVSYTATTPAGLVLQRNTYGHQYDQSKGLTDGSSCHEMFLAICSWRLAQVPAATIASLYASNGTALGAAYQAALLQQAKDIWAWAAQYLRWGGSAQAAAGIYGSLIVLNPSATNFHQLDQITTRPTTQRGHTAFADHGTVSAIILSDMLYRSTGQAPYLTEMQSALVAYPTQTTGFGRTWKGLPCLVNSQDPFTDGMWHAEATRRALARYPNATDYAAFKLAILGAAKMIAAQSNKGSVSPNWGPPEISDPNNSVPCTFWEDDSSYVGGGGNQADGRQVTTASSSMGVIQAADMLVGTEAAIGSGMNSGGVEILPSQTAASLAGAAKARFNPFLQLGRRSALRGVDLDGTARIIIDEAEGFRVGPLGVDIWKAASTHGDHYFFGNVTSVNQGIGILTGQTNQFYLGKPGGDFGVNFASGVYINGTSGAIYLGIGNSPIVSVTAGLVTINTQLQTSQDIRPTSDNNLSLGAPAQRWAGIYLGNNPNVTSDATTKTEVTPFSADELSAARAIAAILTKFKSIDAVERKGSAARWHSGALAQAVVQELQARSLIDTPAPGEIATNIPYDWVGYDAWPARPAQPAVEAVDEVSHVEQVTTPSGEVIEMLVVDTPGVMGRDAVEAVDAGSLYSIRYESLLVWIAAAHEQALAALEAALPLLISRVVALENAHAQ